MVAQLLLCCLDSRRSSYGCNAEILFSAVGPRVLVQATLAQCPSKLLTLLLLLMLPPLAAGHGRL
jgi:hypothetical protein